jgi:hypothetical protein
VQFTEPAGDVHPAIDTAYHAKYDRYGPQIVGTVTGPSAATVTLRVSPAGNTN